MAEQAVEERKEQAIDLVSGELVDVPEGAVTVRDPDTNNLILVPDLAELEERIGVRVSSLVTLTDLVGQQVLWLQRHHEANSKFNPGETFDVWVVSTMAEPGIRSVLAVGGTIQRQLQEFDQVGIRAPFRSYIVERHGPQYRYFALSARPE